MVSQYDESKDEVIEEVVVCEGDYQTEIHAGIYRYNKGKAKIGINRVYSDSDNKIKNKKLGRLSIEEATALLDELPGLIHKAELL